VGTNKPGWIHVYRMHVVWCPYAEMPDHSVASL
jgi:hypothetical protein